MSFYFRFQLACVAIFAVACSGITEEDITSIEKYWGGFKNDKIYTLLDDVFLLELTADKRNHFALSPEGDFKSIDRSYSVPKSFSVYDESSTSSEIVTGRYYHIPTEVSGIVKKGTNIRCKKLVKKTSYSWFFGMSVKTVVYGYIENGEYEGRMVDLTDLSIRKKISNETLSWPNEVLLKSYEQNE